jgi:hypothetical protein
MAVGHIVLINTFITIELYKAPLKVFTLCNKYLNDNIFRLCILAIIIPKWKIKKLQPQGFSALQLFM